MVLSQLAHTLIGSEIVKLGGDIKERISKGEKIYNFTVGDFDPSIFPIPEELKQGIKDAYDHNYTNYPTAEGNLDLREALIQFIAHYQKLTYTPNEVLVAGGGRPLIYALYRTILDPGDNVMYAVPSWNNNHYTHFVQANHIVVEATADNHFMPTAADFAPHIQQAHLLALCSPQNPTGTTFAQAVLKDIVDMVVAENLRRSDNEKKLYILFDQMYWHLTYQNTVHHDPVSLNPASKPYVIYIDAISKVFAATGVRVGWSTGPQHIIAKMKAILTHVGAWAPMAEQKACATYLTQFSAIDAYLTTYKQALEYRLTSIYNGLQLLKAKGYTVNAIAPQAAIYLTVQFNLVGKVTSYGTTLHTQAHVTEFLLQHAALAIVPFTAFGASATSSWYRLSVGTCKQHEIPLMLQGIEAALAMLT